jgi:hypothetical protein
MDKTIKRNISSMRAKILQNPIIPNRKKKAENLPKNKPEHPDAFPRPNPLPSPKNGHSIQKPERNHRPVQNETKNSPINIQRPTRISSPIRSAVPTVICCWAATPRRAN